MPPGRLLVAGETGATAEDQGRECSQDGNDATHLMPSTKVAPDPFPVHSAGKRVMKVQRSDTKLKGLNLSQDGIDTNRPHLGRMQCG